MTGTSKPSKGSQMRMKLCEALGSVKKAQQHQAAAAGGKIKLRLVDSTDASEAAAPATDQAYVSVLGMCSSLVAPWIDPLDS